MANVLGVAFGHRPGHSGLFGLLTGPFYETFEVAQA